MQQMNPSRDESSLSGLPRIAWIAIVAVTYVAAARLGLKLDAMSGFAALVWPPSGIALAALLLRGNAIWPAITIGAFAVNFWTGAPILASIGMAAGNTTAAVLGATLLRRIPGFDTSLHRLRDVLGLIVIAALASTIISATIGVLVLLAAGIMPVGQTAATWRAWWVGDTIGDLAVAPLILVWATWRPRRLDSGRAAEAIALLVVVVATSMLVFGGTSASDLIRSREYMLFPPLIWAALRFGVRGSVTATALVSFIAVMQTALGRGPFISGGLHQSLFELQAFMGITTATFLLLGSSISERKRAALELMAARETAEAANRAKAGFLAAVSHELRTPLNAITGYVDLLSLELDGPLTEKQKQVLSRISHSQRHLLLLIEDVLGFAQVEAGRLSLQMQPVIAADAIASIEPLVAPELRRKNITLDIQPCDSSLLLKADPDKLRQILLNLVTNAIKFTEPPGLVTISAMTSGERIRITVMDTGIGIPAEQLDQVFNPFYQVEQGATRRFGGVGLGLSIVRDIVHAMHGDVEIDSTVGKGTTVSLLLPRCSSVTAVTDESPLFLSVESPETASTEV